MRHLGRVRDARRNATMTILEAVREAHPIRPTSAVAVTMATEIENAIDALIVETVRGTR
jgi:hypothetical protein